MARASWRGYLAVGELACAVGLFAAASTSDRIAFHTVNRKTGNRVSREFVDSVTGKPVEHDDQVKGYETGPDEFIMLEPEEVAAAVPRGDRTLSVEAFLACDGIDLTYFDRPYYLAPSDKAAAEAYGLIRDGMQQKSVAAIASTVLFRRVRTLLIRPHGDGMIATTLNFDYEVRPAEEAFADLKERRIEGEMLDLARHIIATKAGTFDPAAFDDRYEQALADLVRAKMEGRKVKAPKPVARDNVVDLMEALRQSAGKEAAATPRKKPAKRNSSKASDGSSPARPRKAS